MVTTITWSLMSARLVLFSRVREMVAGSVERLHNMDFKRERENFTSSYPHFFAGTLQPQQADWKGRPRCVFYSSLMYNFSVWPPPGKISQVPTSKTRSQKSCLAKQGRSSECRQDDAGQGYSWGGRGALLLLQRQ